MSSTETQLRERLSQLSPTRLELLDDSAHHAGHAGSGGGAHYRLTIVSDVFAGKSTIARHRLVYDAVGDLMRGPVHALAIKALTPAEA